MRFSFSIFFARPRVISIMSTIAHSCSLNFDFSYLIPPLSPNLSYMFNTISLHFPSCFATPTLSLLATFGLSNSIELMVYWVGTLSYDEEKILDFSMPVILVFRLMIFSAKYMVTFLIYYN